MFDKTYFVENAVINQKWENTVILYSFMHNTHNWFSKLTNRGTDGTLANARKNKGSKIQELWCVCVCSEATDFSWNACKRQTRFA